MVLFLVALRFLLGALSSSSLELEEPELLDKLDEPDESEELEDEDDSFCLLEGGFSEGRALGFTVSRGREGEDYLMS